MTLASCNGYAVPLPINDVTHLNASIFDENTLLIEWQISPGYFLYQDQLHITAEPNDIFTLTTPPPPPTTHSINKHDTRYFIYRSKLSLPIHLLGKNAGQAIIQVHYQGCADSGFCYAPQTQAYRLTFDEQFHLSHVNSYVDSDLHAIDTFKHHHWIITLTIFFGLGLLLSFTPCVLPMIPVLSSIIVGHKKRLSTQKAFFLSLSYVLSMSFTYAVLGAVIALMGQNLQHIMQSPSVIIAFSILFILLALSMFNVYELKLPVRFQAKFAALSYQQATGHYLGAAIMGCLSTLILSPCVTPPLIGALSYIAEEGNITLGLSALFMLGLGMGLPLLFIGASLGKWLPQTGQWMNHIKKLFGLILIGVAISLLSRLFPTTSDLSIPTVVVKTPSEVTQALLSAKLKNKPVLLDFYADWCVSCKIMEETTLREPSVLKALSNFIIIKADITQNNAKTRALMKQYHVIAPPTLLFFDQYGRQKNERRHIGEINSKVLIHELYLNQDH